MWDMAEARDRRLTLGSAELVVSDDKERLSISHDGPRGADLDLEVKRGEQTLTIYIENLLPGVVLVRPLSADGEEVVEAEAMVEARIVHVTMRP